MQENNLSSLENTKIEQADTPSLYFVFMYQKLQFCSKTMAPSEPGGLFNKLFSKYVKKLVFIMLFRIIQRNIVILL